MGKVGSKGRAALLPQFEAMPRKDPEALKAYKKAWDAANRVRRREVHKVWCDQRRERVRAYQNAYNARHREKNNANAKQRRERLKEDTDNGVYAAHLYVLQRSDAPHMLKIGRSSHPRLRAKDVSIHQVFDAYVIATFENKGDQELKVHEALSEYRVRLDREWFEIPPETALSAIATILNSNSASSSSTPAGVPSTNLDHPEESDEEDA